MSKNITLATKDVMEYVSLVDDVKNNKNNVSYVEEVSPGIAFVIKGRRGGGGKYQRCEIAEAKNTAIQLGRKENVASRLRGKLLLNLTSKAE